MLPLILQTNMSGQVTGWINWQEAVLLYAKDNVGWTLGDNTLRIMGGVNRLTQKRSYLDIHPLVAVRAAFAKNMFLQTPPLNNRELFRRDGHTCMYCLSQFSDKHLTRDHVIPRSRGGTDCWTNVVTACSACNQRKDNKHLKDSGMRLHAVPYAPNYAEWLVLRNRKILVDSNGIF